jgi:acyl-CoA synthetase (NDP forming)
MTPRELIERARAERRTSMDELSGKRLLAHYGVAVPASILVQARDDLAHQLAGLRPPWAVKVMSPQILHKSDVGGVRVGLHNSAEVRSAIAAMLANPAIANQPLDGFLIEEMAPVGQELVVGGLKDPQFGPLVMVGLGGIFIEVLGDVSFRICPIERIDALEMLDELKGKALLEGARGQTKVSKEAIVDVLLKLGGQEGLLMQLADDVAEADLNPIICSAAGAVAVDARFILSERAAA